MLTSFLQSQKGIAYVVVLVIIILLFLSFIALHSFTQNELRIFDLIINLKKTEYLVRAGLNIAEDRLQQDRWYGDSAPRGTLEPDLPDSKAYIKIYADDYVQNTKKRIGDWQYVMLDHIKVYVYAKYKSKVLYGYGKYIISPEPIYGEKSTLGVDPEGSGLAAVKTFRRMINVKILSESEIDKNVPGFSGADDLESRKKLAAYLADIQRKYVQNYSRNKILSANIKQNLHISEQTISQKNLQERLANLDTGSVTGENLNTLKNRFIRENFERFFMSAGWDISEGDKDELLAKIEILLGEAPGRTADSDKLGAMAAVFGSGHPEQAPEHKSNFRFSRGQTSGERYLRYIDQQGTAGSVGSNPRDYVDSLSKVITGYTYGFKWKAQGVVKYETADGEDFKIVEDVGAGGNAAASFLYFYENQNNPDVCRGLSIEGKVGPEPIHTNYYMENKNDGSKMAVSSVMNFFLKYVDETNCYTPDGSGKGENWWKIKLAPGGPTEAWGVVKDTF